MPSHVTRLDSLSLRCRCAAALQATMMSANSLSEVQRLLPASGHYRMLDITGMRLLAHPLFDGRDAADTDTRAPPPRGATLAPRRDENDEAERSGAPS